MFWRQESIPNLEENKPMRTQLLRIHGKEVYVSTVQVDVGRCPHYACCQNMDGPPVMLGGEFLKGEDGKTKLFRVEATAMNAAKLEAAKKIREGASQ